MKEHYGQKESHPDSPTTSSTVDSLLFWVFFGLKLHATHGQIWAPGQVSPTPRSLKQHPGEVPGCTATPRHQLMSLFLEMVEPSETTYMKQVKAGRRLI